MNYGKFMKRIIFLALCIFMAAAFAGCSTDETTETTQESTESVTITGET